MSTIKTAFGGWVPLVNLDEVASIPLGLVFELGHEFAPSCVRDSFSEGMIFDHVFDCKCLDTDRLVLTDQTCRELMQEVTATISDAGMKTSNPSAGFGAVLRPFLLLGVPS